MTAGEDRPIGEGIAGKVAADRRPVLLDDLRPATITETRARSARSSSGSRRSRPRGATLPAPRTVSGGVAERAPRLASALGEPIDAADRDLYQQKVLRRLGATDGSRVERGQRGRT